MKKNTLLFFLFIITSLKYTNAQTTEPIVLGYFPSWSESWVSTNQDSPLRRIPSFVTHVFLSFAKPDLTYVQGSYNISQTGIDVPYDGCTLKESVSALRNKGIKVILSVGGETYWNNPSVYSNINYQAIKDLVDDIGFAGIDWDFEPNGSFSDIGNTANVQHFIDFINNSRALMPSSQGYIIACAPSGVGALGSQVNNDINSPYKFANRNTLTGETDANLYNGTVATNGINLFGFSASGHMIPVLQAVGNKIDIVAYQGYNCGGSTNRAIMYDSYAYYAELYGFKIAAGVHYPNEPWGPYYSYSPTNVASLCAHIRNYPSRVGDNDGVMIWQLLLTGTNSSAYSFMHTGSMVLNGTSEATAVANSTNFSLEPYTGGALGCTSGGTGGGTTTLYCGYPSYVSTNSYATVGTHVYYNCKIWKNLWWANAGEIPGINGVWSEVSLCSTSPTISIISSTNSICFGTAVTFTATATNGGTTPSYQWKVNGVNAGTNSSTFTSTTLTNGQVVTCVITASGNCTTQPTATSNSVTMIVNSSLVTPSISISANSTTICSGSAITFTATPTNGGTTPAYQWKVNGVNSGTNSASFSSSTLTNGQIVTCVLTSNSPCASPLTATSNSLNIVVNPIPVAPIGSVVNNCGNSVLTATGSNLIWSNSQTSQSITVTTAGNYSVTQTVNGCTSLATSLTAAPLTSSGPASISISANSTTICSGSAITFTATPTNGGTTPAYQWKVNGVNSGTNSAIFSSSTLTNGQIVTCVLTSNSTCAFPLTATSNSLNIVVNPIPAAPFGSVVNNCGNSVLTATGSNLIWSNSQTSQSITVTSAGNYSVTQTVNGCTSLATSLTAAPLTSSGPASIVISTNSTTICTGSAIIFTATPSNGGTNPIYQWLINGQNVGTNSASFSSSTLTNGQTVSCVLTSNSICASPLTATSNSLNIIVNPIPAAPIGSVVNNCDNSVLSAIGSNLVWSNSQNSLSIVVTSSGVYTVTQTVNGCTSLATSLTAVLLPLSEDPSISINSNTTTTICAGTAITFTSNSVNGGTNPSYQWLINGQNTGGNLANFTSSTLTNGQTITCVMTSNSACVSTLTATSNSINIIVNPIPSAPILSVANNCGNSVLTAIGTNLVWSNSQNSQSITVTTAGNFTATQTVNGCTSSIASITSSPLIVPTITFTTFPVMCVNYAALNLTQASPNGGIYSGIGVVNNQFDPNISGIGNLPITYSYTATNGCSSTTSQTITVDECAELQDNNLSIFSIYPNPTSGKISVSSGTNIQAISIYDYTGRLIETKTDNINTLFVFDLSYLTEGSYIVEIQTENSIIKKKIIVKY